jgi:hypothetical protein
VFLKVGMNIAWPLKIHIGMNVANVKNHWQANTLPYKYLA